MLHHKEYITFGTKSSQEFSSLETKPSQEFQHPKTLLKIYGTTSMLAFAESPPVIEIITYLA
jgi:hypothetical protein